MTKAEIKANYQRKYKLINFKKRPWLKHLLYARGRCHNKSHRYTQRGIKCHLIEAEVKYLWFRDKAFNLKKPSLDRISGYGHYIKNNCRFIELLENKRIIMARNDPKTKPWLWKKIQQFDTMGDFIKEYRNLTEASEQSGVNIHTIRNCLCGISRTSGGYKWKILKKR